MPLKSLEQEKAEKKAKEDAEWKLEWAARQKALAIARSLAAVTTSSPSIAQSPQLNLTATGPTTQQPLENPIPGKLALRPEQEITEEQFEQNTGGASDLHTPPTVNFQATAAPETKGDEAKTASEKQNPSHADLVPTSTWEVKNSVTCLDQLPPHDTKPAESNPTTGIVLSPNEMVSDRQPAWPSVDHTVHQKSKAPPYIDGDLKPEPSVQKMVETSPPNLDAVQSATPQSLECHGPTKVALPANPQTASSPIKLTKKEYRARTHKDDIKAVLRALDDAQLATMIPILRALKEGSNPLGKEHLLPPKLILREEDGRMNAALFFPSPSRRRSNPIAAFAGPKRRKRPTRVGSALKLLEIVHEEMVERKAARNTHESRV